jgi:hypothetical protein
VERLLRRLFRGLDDGETSVAALAADAGLGHETVRRLWRNPSQGQRYSPAFFVIADLARAAGISLDALAQAAPREDT